MKQTQIIDTYQHFPTCEMLQKDCKPFARLQALVWIQWKQKYICTGHVFVGKVEWPWYELQVPYNNLSCHDSGHSFQFWEGELYGKDA